MAKYSGTDKDDSYQGTPDDDFIEGNGGADYLNGNGGNDQVFGGPGNDNLHGQDGDDLIEGGDGDDGLAGEEGIDILRGQAGNDRLLLSSSFMTSLAGESVDGGDGIDTLQFDGVFTSTAMTFSIADPSKAQNLAGATVVNVEQLAFRAGSGNDDITGGALTDYIDGSDGNDKIDGGLGDDSLDGGSGTDTIHGGGGNDTIRGSGQSDMLYGDDGDDAFFWSGDALIDGGAGIDKLRVDASGGGLGFTVDVSNPGIETKVLDTRVIGIERLELFSGSGIDRLTGGNWDDILVGNGGDDILIGNGGNDTLASNGSAAQMSGGDGDDSFQITVENSAFVGKIDGGKGFDQLEVYAGNASSAAVTIDLEATAGVVTDVEQIRFFGAGTGAYQVSGGIGQDLMFGGSGNDTFDGRDGDDDIRANGGDDTVYGGAGRDYIEGGQGANRLYGGDGDDVLRNEGFAANLVEGGAGNDEVGGGAGADTLRGGSGNDWLYGSWGDDTMDGGSGTDTAYYDGKRADYAVTIVAGGLMVSDLREGKLDGTDMLFDIETLRFSDGEISLDQFRLFAATGFNGAIGGSGQVFGTAGVQDITVSDLAGRITFDPSFNRGGDIIRLAGKADAWSVVRNGSAALLSDGDTSVSLPAGSAGTAVVFDDGVRTLKVDGGAIKLGSQALGTTYAPLTAASEGAAPAEGGDPAAGARLFMTDYASVTLEGRFDVFGTAAVQTLTLTGGDVTLDPSFNRGGDRIAIVLPAEDFMAVRSGSNVVLDSASLDVRIPIGNATTLIFDGGDERTMTIVGGDIRLGDQLVTLTPVALTEFA